ncbi:hypothetical protein K491DRAFT_83296 [Lophiostoma macrostomum CBS 122681]|uniref:Secreted protein n=1 Tax=Lophiostoma macrostomum CBS 122681 TaxID=1314788 RepID=A0A6A6SVE4_9PLEO|nr:hypothetical protein K491DRAFT_83296 [Lophiostoma macrostomum CBS 122681]
MINLMLNTVPVLLLLTRWRLLLTVGLASVATHDIGTNFRHSNFCLVLRLDKLVTRPQTTRAWRRGGAEGRGFLDQGPYPRRSRLAMPLVCRL